MTVQEAIEILRNSKLDFRIPGMFKMMEAIKIAEVALEEVEQYRVLGTPKEIKIREVSAAQLSKEYLSNLTELREYQSLGTVEGFKSALDSSAEYYNQMKEYKAKLQECEEKLVEYEAVGTITQIYEKIGGLDVELGKYHSLGTVEELKEAREKQVAKKPKNVDTETNTFDCPSCGHTLIALDDMTVHKYCLICGQKLDWEEGGTSD